MSTVLQENLQLTNESRASSRPTYILTGIFELREKFTKQLLDRQRKISEGLISEEENQEHFQQKKNWLESIEEIVLRPLGTENVPPLKI